MISKPWTVGVCVLLAGGLVQCGSPAPATAYVGAVAGTDAVIAVASDGSNFAVYVCGGPSTVSSFTRWFSGVGTAADTQLDALSDGWHVHGEQGTNGWTGSLIEPNGTVHTWTVTAATDPSSVAGVYTVVNSGCRTGVVVQQPGGADTVTAQGAWCSDTGEFEQVTPIAPLQLTQGGLFVHVASSNGILHDLLAQRVTLPLE